MYETDSESEFSRGPLLSDEEETGTLGEFAVPSGSHSEEGGEESSETRDPYADEEKGGDDDLSDEEY